MRPLFGLYWCLCINASFAGQKRVHCKPHVDSKNVVGVCALVVYETPGKPLPSTSNATASDPLKKRSKIQPFSQDLAGSLGGKGHHSTTSLGGRSVPFLIDLSLQH